MYAITNKELNAYSHSPTWERDILDDYERKKKYIIDPEHWMYGSKLVLTKRVKSGIDIHVKLLWRRWIWKPQVRIKFDHYFHWLFFMSWVGFDYINVVDKVLKDHLSEGGKA